MCVQLLFRRVGGDDRPRAGDAATGAGHALKQIAVQLAGLCQRQKLPAGTQTIRALDLDLRVRLVAAQDLLHRSGHAARRRKAAPETGGIAQIVCIREL